MGTPRGCWTATCLLAGCVVVFSPRARLAAFSAVRQTSSPSPPCSSPRGGGLVARAGAHAAVRGHPHAAGGSAAGPASPGAAVFSLCGAAVVAAVVSASRVAMRSQGQGGKFNLGQYFMPKVKGAKKMALFRPRKNYGSHGARKMPRRYQLYDILEEIDDKIPTYTVMSEPQEPLEPTLDVPLMERYPWAGELKRVPLKKSEEEGKCGSRMEPFFGSFTKQNLPPIGRRQRYVERRGWPKYNYPPWINRPLIGTGVKKLNFLPFKTDRRPQPFQMTDAQLAALEKKQAANMDAMDEVIDEMGDDLDSELEAMEQAGEE